jgi:hypothetical protein
MLPDSTPSLPPPFLSRTFRALESPIRFDIENEAKIEASFRLRFEIVAITN